jgi:diguanylate cyclase (GGDEF)-like protein/PAS domain S-box-containing protein
VKLARHPLLLIPALAALLLLIAVGLADRVLVANFAQLERADVEAKSTQIVRALDAELGQLAAYTLDHAQWDEPFRLVVNGGRNFLDISMQTGVLRTIEMDLALVVDAKGKDLFSVLLVGEGVDTQRMTPAPESVLAPMRAWHGRLADLAALPAHQRLFRVGDQIYAFYGARITNSNRSVITDASLFFARRIDAVELARVRRNVVLPLDMRLVGLEGAVGADSQIEQWAATPGARTAMLPTAQPDRVAGVALLRDISGVPIAVLRTEMDRGIFTTGRRNTWFLVGAIACLLAIFAAVALLLIRRLRVSNLAREEEQERYRRVVASLEECVALVDVKTGRLVECNAALQRTVGYAEVELRNRRVDEVFPEYQQLLERWRGAELGGSSSVESPLRAADGRRVDSEVTLAQLHHSGRRLLCLVARDITLRKRADTEREDHRRSLEHLATHDPLTGLPNRLYLRDRLPELLQRATASSSCLALLFLDLDQFKSINDTRGHAAGDELLRETARRLRASIASSDIVVRMGGDEFVLLVGDPGDRQNVAGVAQRVLEAMRQPLKIDDHSFAMSASIGISVFPDDGSDVESLLKHADIALYEAKNAGRDNSRFFCADMVVGRGERVALQQALRRAIGTEQIRVEYQPIFRLQTGELSSFEALVRWTHPELGAVAPQNFIELAEQTGLIHALGDQILNIVVRQLAAWRSMGLQLRPVTLNVSPLQLARESLTPAIRRVCGSYAIDLSLLYVEVTETALMQEGGRHVAGLRMLRELGCKVLIDDFGTGYSNLAQLKNLPLDRIKIDRSLVSDMANDANDAAIVTAVASMAHSLGLEVVAEGIETAEQLLMLQQLGCAYGQGFHFARPMSPEDCISLLEAASRSERGAEARNRALRLVPHQRRTQE